MLASVPGFRDDNQNPYNKRGKGQKQQYINELI
jgi:hypothetical protein